MKNLTRREFLVGSAATALAGVCMCGVGGCATITKVGKTPQIAPDTYSIEEGHTLRLALGQVTQLTEVGGSGKIIDPRLLDPLIIARVAEEEYAATSIKCTHRGVEVEYQQDKRIFECASLGSSEFALDGSRLRGPAKKPLKAYRVSLVESELIIELSA